MSTNTASAPGSGFTTDSSASNVRWIVCGLLFLATTINYMDRNVFGYVEPLLHDVAFMGWNHAADKFHQPVFDDNFGTVIMFFQIAYGVGFIVAGRVIDKLGTKVGYALAILIWGLASMSHSVVTSVAGFCVARIFLGLGESGNFPAALKAVSEWFPTRERAKAVGLFNSGSNASALVAPPLVAFVSAKWGWQAAFIATGSMGMAWLVLWTLFPYNRLRGASTQTQANLAADFAEAAESGGAIPLSALLQRPGLYAFALGKALTDGVWWFYLFYLPQFLNRNYNLTLKQAYPYLLTVYVISSVGSIAGGSLSGSLMANGRSVNAGRKIAMLVMALCVMPVIFVPHMSTIFATNAWPATLLIALAAAAHQGWSANLFSTPGDMFPSTAVSTVVGVGGAAGAVGGAAFTWIVKRNLSLHQLLVFSMAAGAYVVALAVFQLLVPHIGVSRKAA
ncbi:MFS transporter, ACS family, hexuronate transporter [Granulicella rosea]|uniref:MFS transporter, ACS family, hexuronate transporter n=1 Tax=Granulicella rosea TaxID=474952 RepID=A0A239EMQ1_9BACT|nr:MFS transporter [Granulicella rosea]SNS45829.1 MFS transporter, ACS family, hexuronate transporter [Granulicella rosea]